MRSLAAVLVLAVALAGSARAEQLLDGIAAQVGSDVVLVSDVREAAAPTEARARAEGASDEHIRQLYAELLEEMIEQALIRQMIKRAEISATDVEVDEAITNIARENGLSTDKLRETVEAQGMPYALYRERIRGEIERARVISDLVANKVRVEESEVRTLYDEQLSAQPEGGEELLLRVIVVTPQGDAEEALAIACSQVDAAKARVSAGESFELVASEVSEANPEVGGAQGWVHDSQLAAWMRTPVATLPAGGVSERIDAGFGCGIVQLVERRAFVPVSFDQAKDRLSRRILDERMAAEYTKLIDRLRAQTYIERKGLFGEPDMPVRPRASSAADLEPGF